MRVLSGIQPTGRFHWGNYFGAIRQYIDLQEEHEGYYFIANLHALTTVRDASVLRGYVLDAALDLLALGLDPEKAVLFVQSDVPEISQLCWLLMTGTPIGLLERCHAYKDKKSKGLAADAGLFTYPVLMAPTFSVTMPIGCRSGRIKFNISRFVAIWLRVLTRTLDKYSYCQRRGSWLEQRRFQVRMVRR